MAVLQKIRDRGTLLIIVIGGALAAFILSEFIKDPGGSQSRGDGSVGSIFGEFQYFWNMEKKIISRFTKE